jgi:O-antigen ligase
VLRIGIDAEGPFGPSAAWTRSARAAVEPALAGVAVVVLGALHGGFAPTAWGWCALAALWSSALLVLVRDRIVVPRAGLVLAALAVALVAWTGVSVAWSLSVQRTMFEVERDLVYASCVALVLLVAQKDVRRVVAGVVAGAVALIGWALAAFLLATPAFDATQGYLLFRPVGYANAVGALSVLALPPTLVFAGRARAEVRAAASSAGVVLAAALYLTHNRSGTLALACAVVIWLLRTDAPQVAAASLAAVGAPAGAAVVAVAALGVDTHSHRLLGGAAIVACAAFAAVVPRPRLSRLLVVGAARAAIALVAIGAAASVTRLGDRAHYWRAAWQGFRAHPLLGGGAGTFDVQWFRYRDVAITVRDAHNLYLGTLAELGVVGLVLLVALLATPVLCARRARDPLLTAVLASYCAFLVHAAFEWDWKFPLVAGIGLTFGAALVAATADSFVLLGAAARGAGGVLIVVVAAFTLSTLAGNSRTGSAEARLAAGDAATAVSDAERARRYLPWSSEPWLVLADAAARAGDTAAARAALRAAAARDGSDWTVWVRLAAVTRGRERATAARHAFALNPLLAQQ